MTKKHVNIIEKRSLYSQNVQCYFYDFGVYPIMENREFLVCLQLFEAIWKTAANPGEIFISLVQKKYGGGGGGGALYRMKFDLVSGK